MPRRRTSNRLARQAADLSPAVPQVIGHRVLRMAMAGANPSAHDRKEFALMGSEKVMAFQQAWVAMWLQAWRIPMAFAQGMGTMAWSPFLGRRGTVNLARTTGDATARMLSAGLAPIRATAVANSKRLARRR